MTRTEAASGSRKIDRRAARSTARRPTRLLFNTAFSLAVALAMSWLVWSFVSSGGNASFLNWTFVPATVVLLVGLFVLRTEQRWSRPTERLANIIREIHVDGAPLETLNELSTPRTAGGIAPLVQVVGATLEELRKQKHAVAQLENELRDRVRSRTSALERQIGSLRQQATRDTLTGLYNRRMIDAYLPRLIDRCVRQRTELSVLMIDVDNFKPLNDTLGHAAGDELLRNIGSIIRSGIRGIDAAFRVGGDEFVVILPCATEHAATVLAERLVDLVAALVKPLRLAFPPGLSIGCASTADLSASGKKLTAAALLELADKRLYEIKATRPRQPRKAS